MSIEIVPQSNCKLPSHERWYAAGLPRSKCEKAVKNSHHGDFLVRRSGSSNSEILCVNDGGDAVVNFSINRLNDGLYEFVGTKFQTLANVITYVRENPLKSQQGGALHLENAAVLAPWYVGKMGRHECENLIKASSTGEFLVRSRNKGGYAVCVNDQGAVRNFSVTREHGVFIASHQEHNSLEEAIDTFRRRPMKGRANDTLCLLYAARTTAT
eukprot:m.376995 g.376995  ORF g.376995 m.376995 type:complete len:213 (+) comp16705_c0_seq4:422-1060(+)